MSTQQLQINLISEILHLDEEHLLWLQNQLKAKKSYSNERDATPEEAKIIDEYRKNPQLLSAEETKNFLPKRYKC